MLSNFLWLIILIKIKLEANDHKANVDKGIKNQENEPTYGPHEHITTHTRNQDNGSLILFNIGCLALIFLFM